MSEVGTKTAAEIETAGERLLAWAREHGSVLAVAATLGEDVDGPVSAARPEALVAGAVGSLNETEIAVLIAQLDVAVLLTLSQMAAGADMGEETFRAIVNRTRREMLSAAGLDLCDECGG